jgi:uncharacterized membrane protein required for colicin V production
VIIVDILLTLVLIFSFFGGLKGGAVKGFFGLIGLLIALPVTGAMFRIVAVLLTFLPGENWENFFGFYITLAIVSIITFLIFLIPRKLLQAVWNGGLLSSLIGGIFGVISAAIGLAVFVFLVRTFPIMDWLVSVVNGSSVLTWMATYLNFVQFLLPEVFQRVITTY